MSKYLPRYAHSCEIWVPSSCRRFQPCATSNALHQGTVLHLQFKQYFIDNTISKYPSISMISAGSLRPVPFLQGQLAARLFLVGTISGRGPHGVVPEPGRKCRYVFIRSSRVI